MSDFIIPPRKDLTGFTFGDLTVLNPSHKSGTCPNWIYNCLCSCGNIVKVRSSELQCGVKTKCRGKRHDPPTKAGTYYKGSSAWICSKCGHKLNIGTHWTKIPKMCTKCKRIARAKNNFNLIGKGMRDGAIVELRQSGWTLQEIGDVFYVTRERIRQILNEAANDTPC